MNRPHSPLPWLLDSPLVLGALMAIGLTVAALREVDQQVQRAAVVEAKADEALARLAVGTVAVGLDREPAAGGSRDIAGVKVAFQRTADGVELAATTPTGAVFGYRCAIQAGAAPAALGRVSGAEVPVPDPAALEHSSRAADHPCFRRDSGIALRHLGYGTDLEDFVLGEAAAALDLGAPRVILVQGHLWVAPGSVPLRVRCDHDVTVVVEGNFYAGRGIAVAGPGRLVLALRATGGAVAFADRDGDGRWSGGDGAPAGGAFHGAIEGAGSAFFGLPRAADPMTFACGFLVGGYVHARCAAAVEGPFATANPVVPLAAAGRVVPVGLRLYCPEREAVPGFALAGAPRTGLPVPAAGSAQDGERTLYLATPAR
ncbi:MAG: hypothetical protein U1E73_08075 [Planctomycetota bacterium]